MIFFGSIVGSVNYASVLDKNPHIVGEEGHSPALGGGGYYVNPFLPHTSKTYPKHILHYSLLVTRNSR